ncbi:MAG: SMC family ATPase [Thermoplasmata archaeon]|nr:MAG: SMC family ATPase [Thermoplasmata archaeon]
MRLVSLHLWNIRSYEDATVEFGDGVNLFEGDIGSGKSTILLAVEFALFGLAEVASASLLRNGEKEGGVELVFSVKDRTLKATRRLGRTSSGASVKGCALEVDGKETKLSSNEMRQQVLELLEYGERRNPRARLDIFTYSVYTPQEEMRTVLTNDSKMRTQRKDTLRRALDLEEYEIAATNLDRVRLQLDNDAAELRGMASDIDSVRQERAQVEDELGSELEALTEATGALETATSRAAEAEAAHTRLVESETQYREALTVVKDAEMILAKAEGREAEVSSKVAAARERAEELEAVRLRIADGAVDLADLADLERAEARREALRRDLQEAISDMERLRMRMEAAEGATTRVADLEARLKGLKDPTEDMDRLRQDLEDLRSKGVGLEHEVRRLEEEGRAIEEEDEELTSLEGEAKCPRCHQQLTEEHLEGLLADNRSRRREISSRLREAAAQRNRVLEDIEEAERGLADLEKVTEERRLVLHELERARDEAGDIEALRRSVEEHPSMALRRELEDLDGSWDQDRLADLRKRAGAMQELRETEVRLARDLEDLPALEKTLVEVKKSVEGAMQAVRETREAMEEAAKGWDANAIEQSRNEHQTALKEESSLKAAIEGVEKMVSVLEGRSAKLGEEVDRLEGILGRQALHVHVSGWLKDLLIPAIRSMERSVMALMAEEMDGSAGRWFGQLVEDPDLVLSVDEDFVPTVIHQDYEMDLGALSGGERTAAAFAYRLALNGLVRRNATPDQRNLLILDEPTDGFSREQLARMGNVFSDLAADQVVVVSHDRELRTFADRVYMVEKVDGASRVHQVA